MAGTQENVGERGHGAFDGVPQVYIHDLIAKWEAQAEAVAPTAKELRPGAAQERGDTLRDCARDLWLVVSTDGCK